MAKHDATRLMREKGATCPILIDTGTSINYDLLERRRWLLNKRRRQSFVCKMDMITAISLFPASCPITLNFMQMRFWGIAGKRPND